MVRRIIYLTIFVVLSFMALADNYDYTNGTTNSIINLTENELTTLQVSEAMKIKIMPYINTTLMINEIGERNYPNPPTTLWDNTIKESIILEGFRIDIEEVSNVEFSISLDFTQLDTTHLLLDTISCYSFMMSNWFKIPSHTTEFHFEPSWKNFAVAGYDPMVVVEEVSCPEFNFSCPACIFDYNLSCPTFDYSLINLSCPGTNYSLSCPELSYNGTACPSLSCPALTEEEKQAIAGFISDNLVVDVPEDTCVYTGGGWDELESEESFIIGTRDLSYSGEDEEIEGDYFWYGGICFGLALLALLIVKRIKSKKNGEEKPEYLEVE